ncbi:MULTISPECIES: hypothetical protein [Psychrobacter]|nr:MULTISPECIES: hypothetical protein [Psychrobacter]
MTAFKSRAFPIITSKTAIVFIGALIAMFVSQRSTWQAITA